MTCYLLFQLFKCFLLFFSPFSLLLAFEIIERFCYMTEILDKLSVEICKPQEAFYFLYLDRGFLFFNCLDFISFYLHLSSSNDYSQNWDFFHVEIIFRSFKTKIMFFRNFEELDCSFFMFFHVLCQYYEVIHVVCQYSFI